MRPGIWLSGVDSVLRYSLISAHLYEQNNSPGPTIGSPDSTFRLRG
jgi:hypothetical protein